MTTVINTLVQTPISVLLEAVASFLEEKVDLILNAEDDLKVLQEKVRCFQEALKVTYHFFSNERNRDLEGQLNDVFYDVHQDIIERYQTTTALCKRDKINQRLNEIEQHKEMVDLLNTTPKIKSEDANGGEHDNPRETTHLISNAQSPMGRADDKEKVKELLFDGFKESSALGEEGVSIVSVVGQGGIGKTTLAKMVFNEVKEQFGNRRWWVCVSEKPNRMGLLKKILKEVCKESVRELKGTYSLSDLCTRLQSKLSKSKFILVLDDVWELDGWWGDIAGILLGGAKESKILITNRKV
ncbi:hypothetical protein EJ110_NYTH23082 [Nymphaea thermarum]|nr:hypothetical protein EJ110_NYTH23082 [Nymphaea thermarum]